MNKNILAVLVLAVLTSACSGMNIPIAIVTPPFAPSQPPSILSPTPPFVPSGTFTVTLTPTAGASNTPAGLTATASATASATATDTATATSTSTQPASIGLEILGCDTGLDITHGMGEVTNAYPLLRNTTGLDLTNVCATLSASDEGRPHPDKSKCVASLPNGYQVILKLTVDSTFKVGTSIRVDVVSAEGPAASLTEASCRDLSLPGSAPQDVGVVKPIP